MSAQGHNQNLARTAPWFGAGMVMSLLLHLVVGVLLVSTAAAQLHLRAPVEERAAQPDQPRLRLGLEQSSIASINWLGFEDPTPHAAPDLYELDQAALTRNTASPPARAPEQTPQEQAQPDAQQAPKPNPERPAEAKVPALPALDETSPVLVQTPDQGAVTTDAKADQPKPTEQNKDGAEPAESQRPTETTPPAPKSTPAEPTPPSTTETPPNPLAMADDRDSPPVAREISLSFKRLGKPAAGEGVEIHTVRLDTRYKAAQLLAGAVRNPVVLIEFKREKEGPAIVATADYERVKRPDGSFHTNSTGNPDINRILRLNIYRWTATGKAIDELEIGKTLQIRLSINLH